MVLVPLNFITMPCTITSVHLETFHQAVLHVESRQQTSVTELKTFYYKVK